MCSIHPAMAWLGQTVSRLDSRRETAGYIAWQTSAGRVCVTNAAGELGSSVVSLSELALLSGVSSTVQSQLDLLSASSVSIVGAATTVVSDNLTAGRVVVSTSTGKLGVSPTTAAQLAYVDATSSIQAQLNSKQSAGAYATTSELAAGLAGKQPSLGTGSVLTIGGLTIAAHATDRALVSSASGVATSVVTAAELGYLQGVTSGLQSQLTSLVLADGLLTSGKQDAGSYATTTELATKQPLIDNDHLAIAHVSGLSSDLASRSTVLQLNTGLSTKQGVGDYATTTELTTGLATKQASGSYATTTELAAKQDTITGAASSITSAVLTVDRALISNSLGNVQISTTTRTQLGYLDTTTSSVQTQLDSKQTSGSYATTTELTAGLATKQATVTGAVSSVLFNDMTANKALFSNSLGKLQASTTSSTALEYLDATSSVQTQLNTKQATINGAASTIVSSNLTSNRVAVTSSTSKLATATVTTTELGYLDATSSLTRSSCSLTVATFSL